MEIAAQNFRFWVVVEAHKKGFHASDPERLMRWEGLRFEQRMRWEWYFRYRAALLQVEHPKWLIEIRHGRTEIEHTEAELAAQRLTNKIRKAKADLTHVDRRIQEYVAQYRGLYPIAEDGVYRTLLDTRRQRFDKLNGLMQKR